jgi:hypothetical protein
MENPKIDEINAFCREKGLTEVRVDMKVQSRGGGRTGKEYYVNFTCICGRTASKKFKDLKLNPICKLCMRAANPRVSDDTIREQVEKNGHEFVSVARDRGGKVRIIVTFICNCCKNTTREQTSQKWETVCKGSSCTACGYKKRAESSKATRAEHGDEITAKYKATCMKKYGVDSPMKVPEIYQKVLATTIERYGVQNHDEAGKITNAFQIPTISVKIKATMKEKYGVEYGLQSAEIREKIADTNVEKYGCANPLGNAEVRDKVKATNIERYGRENALDNSEIRAKTQATIVARYGNACAANNAGIRAAIVAENIRKYGCENSMQRSEVQAKVVATNIERYGAAHYMQNPETRDYILQKAYRMKNYIMPSGRVIRCQGYEPFAYDILLESYSEEEILCEDDIIARLPAFWYEHNSVKRRYYPDIFIESTCTIIEVKSEWTYSRKTEIVMLKRQAVIDAGFDCEIWIVDRNGKLIRTI